MVLDNNAANTVTIMDGYVRKFVFELILQMIIEKTTSYI